jgi:hypothetical protein
MKETRAQIHGTHKGKPFTAGIVLWDDNEPHRPPHHHSTATLARAPKANNAVDRLW